ncbi:hypothetical protein DRQ00_02730 [candidate division KSB1 bacterium]|nr:MAG: hypothetical protein DRQ00_02730 [candidate division KSB1 bacterium]RKY80546.1 MAG: hypothetical protein DRQ12_00840 [candidate division KSB1 bacterium]
MKLFEKYLTSCVLIFNCVSLLTQLAQSQVTSRLQLVHADSLRYEKTQGQVAFHVRGKVRFEKGLKTVSCNDAWYFQNLDKVVLRGRVVLKDSSRILKADQIIYYGEPERELAEGHVWSRIDQIIFSSQHLVYFAEKYWAITKGQVHFVDTTNQVQLFAGQVEYNRLKKYAIAVQQPRLVKMDTTTHEEIVIRAKRLEYDGYRKLAFAHRQVRITKQDVVCEAEEAEYRAREEKIIIRGNPIVWKEGDQMSGQTIELYLKEMKLQQVHLIGKGVLLSRFKLGEQQMEDKLTGNDIWMYFDQEKLTKIVVKNQATSLYHVVEKNELQGINQVMGDRIVLTFKNGRVNTAIIDSSPGSSRGKFMPPD